MEVRYTGLAVEAFSGHGAVLGFAAFELCDFNIVRNLC